MITLTESDVEQVARDWLANLGSRAAHGPDIASDRRSANIELSSIRR